MQIEFVSDIVCPWCALGFRKLNLAVEKLKGEVDIQIRFTPYELNPSLDKAGILLSTHLEGLMKADKDRVAAIQQHMTQLGDNVGFEFNFRPETRIYNTSKAHQLVSLAEENGKALAVYADLLASYFTLGEDISDDEVLIAIAEKNNLDATQIKSIEGKNRLADKVEESITLVRSRGVTGVPAFGMGDELIQGAREVDDLIALIRKRVQDLAEA